MTNDFPDCHLRNSREARHFLNSSGDILCDWAVSRPESYTTAIDGVTCKECVKILLSAGHHVRTYRPPQTSSFFRRSNGHQID